MLNKFTKNVASGNLASDMNLSLNQLQDSLVNSLNPVFKIAMLDGVLITNIVLVSGVNTISNPILRLVQGVLIVKKSAFADVHTGGQTTNITPNKTIVLTASAPCTIDCWIF